MNTLRDKDHAADRKQIIDGLGLTYTATFQPKPQAGEKYPQLHWLITLSKGKARLEVEYRQGIGHVVGYKQYPRTIWGDEQAERFRKTCETWKLYTTFGEMPARVSETNKTQPPPKLEDVLYCLVSDASVLDYASYEEWAPDLGYDPDSRKGEEIYRQCVKQSLGLRRLIGNETLEALREAYQDY